MTRNEFLHATAGVEVATAVAHHPNGGDGAGSDVVRLFSGELDRVEEHEIQWVDVRWWDEADKLVTAYRLYFPWDGVIWLEDSRGPYEAGGELPDSPVELEVALFRQRRPGGYASGGGNPWGRKVRQSLDAAADAVVLRLRPDGVFASCAAESADEEGLYSRICLGPAEVQAVIRGETVLNGGGEE